MDRLPEHHIAAIHALSGMTDKDSAADPELSATLLATLGRKITEFLDHSLTEDPIHP